MLFVFRRAFRTAKKMHPDAVILDLNTPGGALAETREIIAWIRATRRGGCPVYAYVNPDALSAGALISLATDGIYMSTPGTIGSAMPITMSPLGGGVQELPADVKEKMLSAVRSMVVSLAQENGYSQELAVAMVDPQHPDFKVSGEVVCPQGQLLNLTAKDASRIDLTTGKPVLAKGICDDMTSLLEACGLGDAVITRFTEERAERFARWITALGPLILGLGVLALFIEFKTPGFGVFGITGIFLLMIFFFGHTLAGLAGAEELVLILLGLFLLALEIFVIPGFGITGISGILLILAGAALALIPKVPQTVPLPGLPPISTMEFAPAVMRQFLIMVAVIAVGVWLIHRYLPRTSFYHSLVLETSLSATAGYVSQDADLRASLVGQEGLTRTALRPAGVVIINGRRLNVISNGDFIPADSRVRVIASESTAIVVERIPS
jgi:membrane-bound serine protease (ClpP class)